MATVCVCMWFLLSLLNERTLLASADTNGCTDCNDKIPLEMALRLNMITDEKQLFREFIKPDIEKPIIQMAKVPLGFGPDSFSDGVPKASDEEQVERKSVVKPKPAACVPELRSVSLRESEDPWIYYWPECTRLEQCGGCCVHKSLSCQPIESETVNFQVTVLEYAGKQMIYKGKEIISREKHTKCKCDCIVKEKDCNELQEYRKSECRCECSNKDAEFKCNDNPQKHWNPANCTCECRDAVECSTGTYYDQFTCSCEALPDESEVRYSVEMINSNDNVTSNRKPPPARRRWQPNFSFLGGK